MAVAVETNLPPWGDELLGDIDLYAYATSSLETVCGSREVAGGSEARLVDS